MSIVCLGPGDELNPGNEASMVLEVSYGELRVLLTGDVEGKGEDRLLDIIPNRNYQVLKVAHHGSKNSTSEQFLNCIKPSIAIISAGINNRYGHPHPETVEKLSRIKARILSTSDCGALSIIADGKDVEKIKIIPYNSVYEKFDSRY